MTPPDIPKTNLRTALEERGLVEEFVKFCRTDPPPGDNEIRAWIARRPQLAARAFLPTEFKYLRKQLGCAAPRGGKRPPGPKFYSVHEWR